MTLGEFHFGVYEFENDPWWDANRWTRRELRAAVSDHRAIWFKMDFDAMDND